MIQDISVVLLKLDILIVVYFCAVISVIYPLLKDASIDLMLHSNILQ